MADNHNGGGNMSIYTINFNSETGQYCRPCKSIHVAEQLSGHIDSLYKIDPATIQSVTRRNRFTIYSTITVLYHII